MSSNIAEAIRQLLSILLIICGILPGAPDASLSEIRFPADYIAWSGYTAQENLELWQQAEDRDARYTDCRLHDDGSLSLYVTPVQRENSIRVYEEALSGWSVQCRKQGVEVEPGDDFTSVTFYAGTEEEFDAAAGNVRAVLAALSCLQFASAAVPETGPSSWTLAVTVRQRDDPETILLQYNLQDRS